MTRSKPIHPDIEPPLRLGVPVESGLVSAEESIRPLNSEESARARRVSRRLRDELRTLVRALPPPDQGGSRMARRLGIDRSICQRVLNAIRLDTGVDELLALERAPGVQGLNTFIAAMRATGVAPELISIAGGASEEYTSLIQELGGSQAHLARRIEATLHFGDADDSHARYERARQQAFLAGVELVGHMAETHVQVGAYLPVSTPSGPGVSIARVRGFQGFSARRGATPLVIRSGSAPSQAGQARFVSLDGTPLKGRSTDGVLRNFTSEPIPMVTSRGPHGSLVQVVDYAAGQSKAPVDVFVAHKWAEPITDPRVETPPVEEMWCLSQHPTRRLLFDVFLHETLARECITSLGAHLISPAMTDSVGDRWTDRLADCPSLRILPRSLGQCGSPAYARHVELLTHFFDRLGWDPARFVGYRCEVDYPIWGAGYCLTCDYGMNTE